MVRPGSASRFSQGRIARVPGAAGTGLKFTLTVDGDHMTGTEVADMNGHPEIEMINRRSHDVLPRVAMRCQGSGHVNPVHQASAKQGAERIGIVR